MGDLDPVHRHLCSDVQTLNSSRLLMIPRLYVLIHSHSLLFVFLWKLWMTHPKTHAVLWVKLEWQKKKTQKNTAAVFHVIKSKQRCSHHVPAVNQLQNQSHIRCSPVLNSRHLHGWETRTLPDILQPNNNIYHTSFFLPNPASLLLHLMQRNSFLTSSPSGWNTKSDFL